MIRIIRELQRRNVIKAAISYLVLAYALIEASSILFPILKIDPVYNRILLIVLAVLFPIWLVFAYIYEWTPDGFRKTDDVPEEKSQYRATNRKLNHAIIAGLSIVIVLLVIDRIFHVSEEIMASSSDVNIIAVLPFSHQSAEPDDEFFTSGIHSDVVTRLSGVQQFRIIAKSAVAEFKDYEGDLKVVGRRFNADYVLQGSVRRQNNQVRVTVQLVKASSNQTIWSDEYDGDLQDVFKLQSDIARKIANQLKANLSPEEQNELEQIPTKNIKAYELYLRARYVVTLPNANFDSYQEGVRLLDMAVKEDPEFAKAWTLLIEIHSTRYSILRRDPNNQEEAEKAKTATYMSFEKAKELAPNNSSVLSEQGFILNNIEGDRLGALAAFEKAIELNPSDYVSMVEAAKLYTFFDEPLKSKSLMERAFELTQDNGQISFQLTFAYEILGEYEKMVPVLERLAEFYPEEKHYQVEAKYYKFLTDGRLSSFNEFRKTIENTTTEFPWDERAVKNKEMVVAMFNNQFEEYHDKWQGHMASHTASGHSGWVCPMVANDNLNQARLLLTMGDPSEGQKMLKEVESIVLKPVNLYSVCTFNPEVYLPKLDFMKGDTELAKQKLDEVAIKVLQNKSFPTGAVERAVLVQAADMINPEKVYYYYNLAKNSISFISFEAVCAEPWTYPNLLKDPKFIEDVKTDGRFVEFLESFGFLKS